MRCSPPGAGEAGLLAPPRQLWSPKGMKCRAPAGVHGAYTRYSDSRAFSGWRRLATHQRH